MKTEKVSSQRERKREREPARQTLRKIVVVRGEKTEREREKGV